MNNSALNINKEILYIANQTIKENNLLANKSHLILMVSGGADSVTLAYLMTELANNDFIDIEKDNIAIMHLDHMIRGNESSDDAKFVEGLANHLGLEFFKYKKDVKKLADETHDNLEAVARHVRYRCVCDASNKLSLQKNIINKDIAICVAHTSDDRVENFYMRSIVGTGPGGLSSLNYMSDYIPSFGNYERKGDAPDNSGSSGLTIIRPLLDISKDQLKEYLNNLDNPYMDADGHLWREDSTNFKCDRFRSFVRNKIVPLAKSCNENLNTNLCNTMNLIADEDTYIENIAKEAENKNVQYIKEDNNLSAIIYPEFTNLDIVIQRRVAYITLRKLLPAETRINTSSISSIIHCANTHNYTENIQGNLIIHSNKQGIKIQKGEQYRKDRNRL